MKKLPFGIALLGLSLGLLGLAKAQSGPPAASRSAARSDAALRWQSSMDAFAAADRERAPAAGGVLFVGSSSIRLWNDLETAFGADAAITRRGFGGSRLSDCVEWVDRLVIPYRPRLVVLYAGDNDIAEGASPAEVAARFDAFVAAVRAGLPEARIAYLSIKPSPLRAAWMEQARQANALIAERVRAGSNLDFIDVYSLMLAADGRPREDLYDGDRLHLNAAGYSLWRQAIAGHLGAGPSGSPAMRPALSAAR